MEKTVLVFVSEQLECPDYGSPRGEAALMMRGPSKRTHCGSLNVIDPRKLIGSDTIGR